MKTETKRTVAAKLMLFSSAVIWGSSFFILKNTLDELPVYFLLCVRFLFSAILLSIVFFKKWKLFSLKYLWTGAITGAFLGFAYIFQTIGLKHTTPGTNAFLTTVYCVIVPFLSWAVSKKRPDVYNFIAAAICITGIGLVCLDGKMSFSFLGEGFTLICGIFYALQIVAVEKWCSDLDVILHTIIQFFTAFFICFIFFILSESFPKHISTGSVLSLVYVTVFVTALCFVFMNMGIKHTTASSSSLILCLESVFGILFSMIFYHERPTLQTAVGFVIIFVGIVLNETKPKFALKKN